MRSSRSKWYLAALLGGIAGLLALAARNRDSVKKFLRESEARVRHSVRVSRRRSERRRHYEEGRWKGILYRTSTRFPDPDVDEDLLADRVRSMLGPLEKRLDIPRVHVTVEGHRVILHGDVDHSESADAIVTATKRISGVREVVSHLTVGFTRSDTRPSQGRATKVESVAYKDLTRAATGAGVGDAEAPAAAGAVLLTLFNRLPVGTRQHLASHLPRDVVELIPPVDWKKAPSARVHHPEEFIAEVATFASMPPESAGSLVTAVFSTLRELVPEEVQPVAASLPSELRELWTAAA